MAEYIQRATAIAKLTALEVTKPSATMADAKRMLADMPAADVVPVVRCRDCKHYRTYMRREDCRFWELGENECESWGWCKALHCEMPPHAFCYLGERKDKAE